MDWIEAENGKSNNFKLELAKIEQQLSNLVSSIANGNYSETIMKAISEKEKKSEDRGIDQFAFKYENADECLC